MPANGEQSTKDSLSDALKAAGFVQAGKLERVITGQGQPECQLIRYRPGRRGTNK